MIKVQNLSTTLYWRKEWKFLLRSDFYVFWKLRIIYGIHWVNDVVLSKLHFLKWLFFCISFLFFLLCFVFLFTYFSFLPFWSYLAVPRPTLGHLRVGSLSIDTSFWPLFIFPLRSHRKTLSEVLGKLTLPQVVLELETFRFLVQHLNPLSHSPKSQCNSVVRKGIFLEWYGSESFFFLFVKWLIF